MGKNKGKTRKYKNVKRQFSQYSPDEVLEVLLAALVGDLGEPRLLAGERLVKVEQLQLSEQ